MSSAKVILTFFFFDEFFLNATLPSRFERPLAVSAISTFVYFVMSTPLYTLVLPSVANVSDDQMLYAPYAELWAFAYFAPSIFLACISFDSRVSLSLVGFWR